MTRINGPCKEPIKPTEYWEKVQALLRNAEELYAARRDPATRRMGRKKTQWHTLAPTASAKK